MQSYSLYSATKQMVNKVVQYEALVGRGKERSREESGWLAETEESREGTSLWADTTGVMAVRACQAWKAGAGGRAQDTGFQTQKTVLDCGSNQGFLIWDPENPVLESWLCHFTKCHPVLFSFPHPQVIQQSFTKVNFCSATTGWARPNPSLDKLCRSGGHDP